MSLSGKPADSSGFIPQPGGFPGDASPAGKDGNTPSEIVS
jgi:hypothetical protein